MSELDEKIVSTLNEIGDKYPADSSDIRWALQEIKAAFQEAGYVTVDKRRYRDEYGREYIQYTFPTEYVRVPQFDISGYHPPHAPLDMQTYTLKERFNTCIDKGSGVPSSPHAPLGVQGTTATNYSDNIKWSAVADSTAARKASGVE